MTPRIKQIPVLLGENGFLVLPLTDLSVNALGRGKEKWEFSNPVLPVTNSGLIYIV